MTPAARSAALMLLLLGCAADEPSVATAADPAPAPAPVAEAQRSDAPEAAPAGFDVTGAYFPIDALPADFAELEHLLLATIDENAAPAPLNGFLRPKSRTADDYTLVSPSLDVRRLTFVTTSQRDLHYAFDGQFEVARNFAENPPDHETVVLSGTLRRIRDGQTVASTPVRFRYEAGD